MSMFKIVTSKQRLLAANLGLRVSILYAVKVS